MIEFLLIIASSPSRLSNNPRLVRCVWIVWLMGMETVYTYTHTPGNYTLKFDVTGKNAASAEALATTTLRVHCDIPTRVVILQRDYAEPGKASPHEVAAAAAVASAGGAIAGAPTTVMNIGTYPLRAAVLDTFMRPMANTSIFSFEWALDRPRVTHDGGASHLTALDFHDEMGLVKVCEFLSLNPLESLSPLLCYYLSPITVPSSALKGEPLARETASKTD